MPNFFGVILFRGVFFFNVNCNKLAGAGVFNPGLFQNPGELSSNTLAWSFPQWVWRPWFAKLCRTVDPQRAGLDTPELQAKWQVKAGIHYTIEVLIGSTQASALDMGLGLLKLNALFANRPDNTQKVIGWNDLILPTKLQRITNCATLLWKSHSIRSFKI